MYLRLLFYFGNSLENSGLHANGFCRKDLPKSRLFLLINCRWGDKQEYLYVGTFVFPITFPDPGFRRPRLIELVLHFDPNFNDSLELVWPERSFLPP